MSDSTRLFFALTPPAALQQTLVNWRASQFSADIGRPVAAANLHLTLAFSGEVSGKKQAALIAQASRIRQPRFQLTLDDAGHWLRSGVVWLGPARAPRGLLQLAALLRARCARAGCPQSPQPFHPHITLLRQVQTKISLPAPGFSWQFAVTHFTLYSAGFSQGRTRYQALQHWTLD
ncbi:2'-5' RNA ligase [Erwinia sp. OLTSP20]|uniref:RNA 2',3'-cyclic phosphodiesterase n=1 Tax=unclassified Erwinia TaxID=2622719 RepID=UPI000C18269E|nr:MULTISPECIES: RNA 2',3'-cyclic phosphodiesterase [unclassified Erwinia]PIJ49798.1 2'-5' RNA ligase [Erwinia sp. OAMSP11]PIJ70898.1 2'-5' RNA ligase [Erwinia sp. OLSSP12]PIJ80263.1 2'-5' RNA ligase [Erwinia sp. OLCASP19]PIJ82387.1 2'-5' RNA ligase [Erwinia sp. OLMTSP26]PIJ85073.1 2'-5' RNA ligase [Erwinia sp. OLMDSP33]